MTNSCNTFNTLAPQIKLIVYDLDGTLIDSFKNIWSNVDHTLERFGLPRLDLPTVKSYVGDGVRQLWRRCLGPDRQDMLPEILDYYQGYYLAHPNDHVELYPGVAQGLAHLHGMGLKQAILTNKPDPVTQAVCDQFGLYESIYRAWGEDPAAPRKPDGAALTRVIDHFGLAPAQCVMVGDGPADYQVARNAGAHAIGVTWGQLDHQQLQALAPDAIVHTMDQLVALFDEQYKRGENS